MSKTIKKPNTDLNINLKFLLESFITNSDPSVKFEFDYFLSVLKQKQSDATFISTILIQLKPLIHILEPKYFEKNLVHTLFFEIKWAIYYSNNHQVLGLFADFLVDLNSAYTSYIQKCLSMVIKVFLITSQVSIDDNNVSINCLNVYKLSHDVLNQIIKIAPTCKQDLVKQLDQNFPYMIKDTQVQEAYIKNLLKIAGDFSDLRLKILEICVQKLLKIDVNCRREQILDQQESNEATNSELNMKNELADRLDVMMLSLFNFIDNICFNVVVDESMPQVQNTPVLNWDMTKLVYKDLLFIFDKYILLTYGSNHVQFLLFYICGLKFQLAEGFLDYLWKKFNSNSSCIISKQVCAYYLGSLLARAKYVPLGTCTATLHLMIKWIHSYIEKNNKNCLLFELHRNFYALCQTVFYVIIFRNRQLFNEESGQTIDLVKSWKLNDIVSCKLNPLRYCLPTVRKKFSKISYIHQIAYCYKIIDDNNRITLPISNNLNKNFLGISQVDKNNQIDNPLDSFFPFDPYLLIRSKPFITKHYVEFRDAIDDDMDISDQDSDDSTSVDSDETDDKNLFDFEDSDLENSIE